MKNEKLIKEMFSENTFPNEFIPVILFRFLDYILMKWFYSFITLHNATVLLPCFLQSRCLCAL